MSDYIPKYSVNTRIEVPLYEQLVDMITSDVNSGRLPEGSRLPTVRELSDSCGIARGTVMRAYDELEKIGTIEKIQGRGSFIRRNAVKDVSRKDAAMSAIDAMLDSLETLGFSQEEINIFLNLKLRERATGRRQVKIAVVECNQENLRMICDQVRELPDVEVSGYHLEEVRSYPYVLEDDLDLIVVSAAHAPELEELLQKSARIVKAALKLLPRTVSEIARIDGNANIGIICRSERFASLLSSACREYLGRAESAEPFLLSASENTEAMNVYLADKDTLLVPFEIERLCGLGEMRCIQEYAKTKNIIKCEYRIDDGSFLHLEDRIREVRDKK